MTAPVLVLNSGSSSLKYQLVDAADGSASTVGLLDRIGEAGSHLRHVHDGTVTEREVPVADHREAMELVLATFAEAGPELSGSGVRAVGHRVVMGGRDFDAPSLVDEAVLDAIEGLSPLAPLHNPAHLATIRVALELLAEVPPVAVFDTAFFSDLPPAAAQDRKRVVSGTSVSGRVKRG